MTKLSGEQRFIDDRIELHRLILGLGRDPDIFGIGALLVQFNFLVLVAWLLAESLGPQ